MCLIDRLLFQEKHFHDSWNNTGWDQYAQRTSSYWKAIANHVHSIIYVLETFQMKAAHKEHDSYKSFLIKMKTPPYRTNCFVLLLLTPVALWDRTENNVRQDEKEEKKFTVRLYRFNASVQSHFFQFILTHFGARKTLPFKPIFYILLFSFIEQWWSCKKISPTCSNGCQTIPWIFFPITMTHCVTELVRIKERIRSEKTEKTHICLWYFSFRFSGVIRRRNSKYGIATTTTNEKFRKIVYLALGSGYKKKKTNFNWMQFF